MNVESIYLPYLISAAGKPDFAASEQQRRSHAVQGHSYIKVRTCGTG